VTESEPRRGQNAVSRLGRLLGLHPLPADVAEELTALRGEVSRLTQANAELQQSQTASGARLAAVSDMLERLEKQTTRAGKEQFKANALAEAQQQSVKALLEQVREAETLREREMAVVREALKTAKAEGRQAILKSLLPVLDGLDEALAAGERRLARPARAQAPLAETDPGPAVADPLPWPTRLLGAWELLTNPAAPRPPPDLTPPLQTQRETVAAWLRGLALVQARLLDLLAAEDVYPIETQGQRFDPHQHIAIDTAPVGAGGEPGVIVQETRRGYHQGHTVLRYAEVVVSK
jgi:molecular chaperone GrpE (heat shock protein)